MVTIQHDFCIGCGICVHVCAFEALSMEEGFAVCNEKCADCGHCMAICPADAVTMDGYPRNEVLEYDPETFQVNPEQLLNFMKYRRSMRRFLDKAVEKEFLERVLKAGQYAPTAGNRQPLRFLVVQKDIKQMKEMTLQGLRDFAIEHPDEEPMKTVPRYRKRFIDQYEAYWDRGIDRLFFHAPALVVVIGDEGRGGSVDVDGGLAASQMELMAFAMGLGTCYIGFFVTACGILPELRKALNLGEREKVITSFIIGYPDLIYQRTVNRKPIDVEYR